MTQTTISPHIKKLIKQDNRFETIVSQIGYFELPEPRQPFPALVNAIIYQQLSGKAATTIYNRFLGLYADEHPTEKELIDTDHQDLSGVGLSNRKAEYVRDIARFFHKRPMSLNDFELLTNDEIIEMLTSIRGIGPWSVDMFLMFTLHRLDVFPVLDLGIKKGFSRLYQTDELCSDEFMLKESQKWKPYRTIASMYLWRILDDDFDWTQ